ncbi:sugar-binding protein, partial [Actinoplanes sp. ATCC 53533]|uniref:RHS repeat-associated core domain-containing protein n=1 Tax=Actinoplanes sp. ATCC 53533 TaxID=1288362 RepID=UPI001002123E
DVRSNRRQQELSGPGTDGVCSTDGATLTEHSYDSADRLTDAGYSYDAFGRTTAVPGGLTNTYYANDLVQRQELGDARQTWTLDPAYRFRGFSTETEVDGAWIGSTSKLNHYGDDTDEVRWVVEDTAGQAFTRNVAGPDSDLAATTTSTGEVQLQLTNLHGDVAVTINSALSEPELYDYDEFGVPVAAQATQRYGWLGGKQRSAEAMGGVILMGVRLYSPSLGRFLQVDPVVGGSCNAYEYTCADPVNKQDLDGKFIGLILRGAAWAASKACRAGRNWCARAGKYVGRQVWRGVRWGGRQIWRGATKAYGWAGRRMWSSNKWGVRSRFFGNKGAGKGVQAGRFNQPGKSGWRIGWSVKKYKQGHYGWVFRVRTGSGRKWDLLNGPRT